MNRTCRNVEYIERIESVKNVTMPRLAPFLAATMLLAAAIAAGFYSKTPARADSSAAPDPSHVIALILRDNPGLQSYRAHAHLDIRQVNFPWLHPVMDGQQYYSQPGFTTYDFPHTPSYLRGVTKIEGSIGEANRWTHCYDIAVTADRDAYELKMTPKIRGEVREMDVTVDRHDGTVHHIDWFYWSDGDHASLDQYFGFVSGFRVVTLQQSTYSRHHIHAIGNATFDNFEFNVPVPTPTPTPSDPLHACDN
jgi:hypothetical protein